jgi:DeoR family transcriptional regulator, suf operon transcriptional repressor
MKPTTRLRILDHIHKHQTTSVKELKNLMGTTSSNIRYHLAILEMTGLIEVNGSKREGRGKPQKIYGISQRMQGNGSALLAHTLLKIWLGGNYDEDKSHGLKLLATRLAGISDGITIATKRLEIAIKRLNQLYYQARWEAGGAGPRLIFGHCPYKEIITEHPELCQMDEFLLESILGMNVRTTTSNQINDRGIKYCTFQMTGNIQE